MDEREHGVRAGRADGGEGDGDDREVGRLLEHAGARPPVPREDLEAVVAAARSAWRRDVDRRLGERLGPSRLRARLVLVAAAALVVAVTAGGWWWVRRATPPPVVATVEAVRGSVWLEAAAPAPPKTLAVGDELAMGARVSTAGGAEGSGRVALRLKGGASLRLDAGTRLHLVDGTTLTLAGGAVYADTGVQGGPVGGALEVRTAMGTARDVGTRFAVRLEEGAAEERSLVVRVRQGVVEVERAGSGDVYRAEGGEELVLGAQGPARRRAVPGHGARWEWVVAAAPAFEIEGRRLGELLDWVARETGWRVRFADPSLEGPARAVVLHGDIGDLPPDRVPFVVLPGAGLEAELSAGTLRIRRHDGAPRD